MLALIITKKYKGTKMKKTNRKNKTNQVVTWPTGIFTHKDAMAINSHFESITLRTRINGAKKDGTVTHVGVIRNGMGRPSDVYAYGPVTQVHLDEAKNRQVILAKDLSVNVLSISKDAQTEQPAVLPDVLEAKTNVTTA